MRGRGGFVALAAVLCALVFAAQASAAQLTTTFAGGNGSAGASFDLNVKTSQGIEVTGIDIAAGSPAGTPMDIAVWTRAGTAAGNLTSNSGWIHRGTAPAVPSAGLGLATFAPISFTLSSGLHGVVVGSSGGLGFTNGTQTVESASLALISGSGLASPVLDGGATQPDRIFNGTIFYDILAPGIESGPGTPTVNTQPTFTFSAGGDPVTFQCRTYLDEATPPDFVACSGPGNADTPPAPLADGKYTFEVRSVNADDVASRAASWKFEVVAAQCDRLRAANRDAGREVRDARSKLKHAKIALKKAKAADKPGAVKRAKKKIRKAKKKIRAAQKVIRETRTSAPPVCAL